jgi:hypothetical protein
LAVAQSNAVIVVGMHRSWTSAVAQLLIANGFYGGEAHELLAPNFTNVYGHFEHLDVGRINAELLSSLGATWFVPPRLAAVDAAVDRLSDLTGQPIREVLERLSQHGTPVIKDPRATIVLPAWIKAAPDAVFVACVRNPLSVAQSMQGRDGTALPSGLALWEIYNAALLRWLPLERTVFVDSDVVAGAAAARRAIVEELRHRLEVGTTTTWVDTFDRAVFHQPPAASQWHQRVSVQQAMLHAQLTKPGGPEANGQVPLDAAFDALTGYEPDREGYLLRSELAFLKDERASLRSRLQAATAGRQRRAAAQSRLREASTTAQAMVQAVSGEEPQLTEVVCWSASRRRPAASGSRTAPRIAVVAHVFYPELWHALHLQLGNLQVPFDLHATVVDAALAGQIAADRPAAVLHITENRGRDVVPFLGLLQQGVLDGYDAVLKLHTKLSPHRVDGDEWRTALWHGLLSDPASAERLAHHVGQARGAGCLVPAGNILPFTPDDPNWPAAAQLASARGLPLTECEFPAGSMYWLAGAAVDALAVLPVVDDSPESGALDGGFAHVLERLVGVALAAHHVTIETSESVLSEANAIS